MLRSAIKKALVDTNTPSITIALIDGEHTIWAEAFGRMAQAGKAPTTETMFADFSKERPPIHLPPTIASPTTGFRRKIFLDKPKQPQYTPATEKYYLIKYQTIKPYSIILRVG